MDLLLTKTPPDDIKNSVLPMVYRAVEASSVQIQVQMENCSLGLFLQMDFSKNIIDNFYLFK